MVNMRVIFVLVLGLAAVAAIPQRIIGGEETTIDQYPSMVSLLWTWDGSTFWQSCGGSVINSNAILTAAHCTQDDGNAPARWRARVGSTFANSGGVVHTLSRIINHPNFFGHTMDNDIAIVRTATSIAYVNNAVQPGAFAGSNYNVADNAAVWAAGWGFVTQSGPASEQLRHVQMWIINRDICKARYNWSFFTVTDNMLCTGWLDVGGRDQCTQDSGGPLYHNGVIVGVCSFGEYCADGYYPSVNTFIPNYITWIQANA